MAWTIGGKDGMQLLLEANKRHETLAKALYLQTAYLIGITIAFFFYTVLREAYQSINPLVMAGLSAVVSIIIGFLLSSAFKRYPDFFMR
jgi:putative flippase GtrA